MKLSYDTTLLNSTLVHYGTTPSDYLAPVHLSGLLGSLIGIFYHSFPANISNLISILSMGNAYSFHYYAVGIDFIFIVPFLSAECCAIKSVICHWAVLYCGNLFWGLGAQSGRANTLDSFIFQEIYCSHNPGKYLPIWRIYFLWHALLRNSTSSPQQPYHLAFEN